jgi:leucyl-tRNA synthetase
MPVDWYNGGMEHTTLHLLYSRFWSKFLFDIDILNVKEPYAKRTSHGMILGENGEKMSKSRGNVVNPDDIIRDYGADTMRLYEMFIGDFEQSAPWNTQSIKGCKRFLERVMNLVDIADGNGVTPELEKPMHKLIKKVTQDIDNMRFNTAIAAMMGTINTIYEVGKITKDELTTFAKILSPFAPHIAEEINSLMGNDDLISIAKWPEYDESKTVDDTVELPVQINGKVRSAIMVPKDADKDAVIAIAKADEKISAAIDGKVIIKEIVVPGKIVNIVIKA